MEESVKIKIAIDAIKTNNLPLLKLVIDFETQLQALAGIHFRTIEKLEPKEQQKHREVEILKAQLTTIGKYAVGVLGLSELNQELVQIPFVAKIGFTAAFTERKLTAHTVLVGGVRQALTPQHLETLRIEFEHKVQMELSHFQLPTLTSNTDIREVLNKLKERYQAAETILEQFVGQKTSAAMAMQDTQQKLAQERQETALIYVQNSGGMNEDANSSQEAIESLLKMNLSLDAREPGTQDTLLHIAIRQGSRQIIDCLLHCGADLHAINANDISIMAEAVYGQDVHTIAYLISEGVALPPQYIRVVDRNANTLLHHAIHGAQYDLAMHLLEKGANLFAENTRG